MLSISIKSNCFAPTSFLYSLYDTDIRHLRIDQYLVTDPFFFFCTSLIAEETILILAVFLVKMDQFCIHKLLVLTIFETYLTFILPTSTFRSPNRTIQLKYFSRQYPIDKNTSWYSGRVAYSPKV